MDVHLETRPRHADGGTDAVLLINHEILRKHVKDFAARRQRHRLGCVDRPPHVVSRDLPVLAGHSDDAAAVEPLDMRSRQREMDRVDLDPRHQLRLTDGFLDRVHGRLEVHDDAALDTARLSDTQPHDIETAVVQALPDDRADARRAHIEPNEISFLTIHSPPP